VITLVVCIEDHKFSPENFWNGRWRSEWNITIDSGNAKIVGLLKTQVNFRYKTVSFFEQFL